MTDSMDAAIYRRPGEIEVAPIGIPAPTGGEALVEIDYCGICGTDLHFVLDGWGRPDSVFGHEWSGTVVDGAGALTPGTPVVGLPAVACGTCRPCLAGRPSMCTDRREIGTGPEQGAYTRFVTLDARRLMPVPAGVEQRHAAYTEPLAVALHAVNVSPVGPGDRALVFGAGPIGAAIIAILVDRGIEVAAVEPGQVRQGLAAALGATVVAVDDLDRPDHPGTVAADAVDVVFESSGARAAAETALTQLVSGGTLVIVGTGMDFPRLDTNRVLLNELHLTGAFEYDIDGFDDALALIGSGRLRLDLLIEPESVGLEGLLDAMNRLRAGELAGKVLVHP